MITLQHLVDLNKVCRLRNITPKYFGLRFYNGARAVEIPGPTGTYREILKWLISPTNSNYYTLTKIISERDEVYISAGTSPKGERLQYNIKIGLKDISRLEEILILLSRPIRLSLKIEGTDEIVDLPVEIYFRAVMSRLFIGNSFLHFGQDQVFKINFEESRNGVLTCQRMREIKQPEVKSPVFSKILIHEGYEIIDKEGQKSYCVIFQGYSAQFTF